MAEAEHGTSVDPQRGCRRPPSEWPVAPKWGNCAGVMCTARATVDDPAGPRRAPRATRSRHGSWFGLRDARAEGSSLPPMGTTMYELAGGAAGIRRLTDRFYALVFADDLLAPLFHQHDDHHADRLAMWLTELFGGPAEHSEQRGGFEVMEGAHHNLQITEPQRARWAAL